MNSWERSYVQTCRRGWEGWKRTGRRPHRPWPSVSNIPLGRLIQVICPQQRGSGLDIWPFVVLHKPLGNGDVAHANCRWRQSTRDLIWERHQRPLQSIGCIYCGEQLTIQPLEIHLICVASMPELMNAQLGLLALTRHSVPRWCPKVSFGEVWLTWRKHARRYGVAGRYSNPRSRTH